jgi:hypothetical protein
MRIDLAWDGRGSNRHRFGGATQLVEICMEEYKLSPLNFTEAKKSTICFGRWKSRQKVGNSC